MSWLARLFSTSGFEPHGYCLLWNGQLVSLYVVSDLLIGVSYLVIASTLTYLAYRGRLAIPFSPVIFAFGGFILACGATHFIDVLTLWVPAYWFAGAVKAVTAVASVATAIMLPPWIPRTLEMMRARTEEKAATVSLRESEEGFRNATRFSAIGHALIGLDGTFVEVNDALAAIVGYTPTKLTSMTFQSITHPDDLEADLSLMRRLVAGEVDSYEMEKRYVHASGRIVSAQLNVSVVRNLSGKASYFIAQVQDLTERRMLEHQLRESHKLEAVGRLAGGVAHDFNNLLSAILAFADCAAIAVPDPSEVRDDIEEIRAAAMRGSRLTRQLLTFGRRHLRRPSDVDIASIVRESELLFRQLAGSHIELHVDAGENAAVVHSDPSELDQVLLNLIVNARDAMPSGGTLCLAIRHVELGIEDAVSDLPSGSYVRIAVSDTGSGIAADILPHIFEPFFTTKGEAGTGLGLSTAYGIVKQNAGAITVATCIGAGTTFEVFLPTSPEDGRMRQSGALHREPSQIVGTVMLVEDEASLRQVCERVLVKGGHKVIAARHGGDAVRLMAEHGEAVELVITDLVMPEMGGRELAAELHLLRPDLPVIFMSGYTNDEISRRALHDPNVAFLAKPFEPSEMLRAVSEILARNRRGAEARAPV